MEQDGTFRECRSCKVQKYLEDEFRTWYIRSGGNWQERHSRTCRECEAGQVRASEIAASTRARRAQSYSTDQDALAIVDVRRRIGA